MKKDIYINHATKDLFINESFNSVCSLFLALALFWPKTKEKGRKERASLSLFSPSCNEEHPILWLKNIEQDCYD